MPCDFWKSQQGLSAYKFIKIMLIALLGRVVAPSRPALPGRPAPSPHPHRIRTRSAPAASPPRGFPGTPHFPLLPEGLGRKRSPSGRGSGGARRGRAALCPPPPPALRRGFTAGLGGFSPEGSCGPLAALYPPGGSVRPQLRAPGGAQRGSDAGARRRDALTGYRSVLPSMRGAARRRSIAGGLSLGALSFRPVLS